MKFLKIAFLFLISNNVFGQCEKYCLDKNVDKSVNLDFFELTPLNGSKYIFCNEFDTLRFSDKFIPYVNRCIVRGFEGRLNNRQAFEMQMISFRSFTVRTINKKEYVILEALDFFGNSLAIYLSSIFIYDKNLKRTYELSTLACGFDSIPPYYLTDNNKDGNVEVYKAVFADSFFNNRGSEKFPVEVEIHELTEDNLKYVKSFFYICE